MLKKSEKNGELFKVISKRSFRNCMSYHFFRAA
jgi:hypothetical protein